MLDVIVLGSAAGGGLPQWNCRCEVCRAAWEDPGLRSGQASVALSGDGGSNWFLVNASPEPFSNVVVSTGEDIATGGLLALAIANPIAAALIALILVVLSIWLVFEARRFLRRVIDRVNPPPKTTP